MLAQFWEAAIGLLSLYVVAGAIYRLYLSPLAKFPGPKLAALTLWYEFYFDVILRGQFTFHIQELHKRYGTEPGPGYPLSASNSSDSHRYPDLPSLTLLSDFTHISPQRPRIPSLAPPFPALHPRQLC